MCDYCDCRSHPAIAALSAEHDELLSLLASLRSAIDADDAAAARPVLARLHDLLAPHADREERGVFTELRRAEVGDGYVEAFEDDHVRIHALLEAAAGSGWEGPARRLADELAAHIGREESDLFPAAHQLLTPHQWDAVDRAAAVRAVAPGAP